MIYRARGQGKLIRAPTIVSKKNILKPKQQEIQHIARSNRTLVSCDLRPKRLQPLSSPMSPCDVIRFNFDLLTPQERAEIFNYKEIYFVRLAAIADDIVQDDPDYFIFTENEHIRFRYRQIKELGRGSYGSVISCLDHQTMKNVAIKLVRDRQSIHKQLIIEKEVLENLKRADPKSNHKIPIIYDIFFFRGFYGFVLELLGSDIYSTIKNSNFVGLDDSRFHIVSRNVSEAVLFLHSLGYLHCDIKPENILWTNSRKTSAKLIDFGCCCKIGYPLFSYVQSRFYRAPEVILGAKYGKEIDIWSFGCLLYELKTGKVLFQGVDEKHQIALFVAAIGYPTERDLCNGQKVSQFFNEDKSLKFTVSTPPIAEIIASDDLNLSDLILRCLHWHPSDRIDMQNIVDHPFMKSSFK